jgi:transcriptional regulator with XRE-family HTH domain
MTIQTFGNIVRTKRKEFALTLEEVAKKVKTSKGYICSIERGLCRPPSVQFIKAISKLLKLDATRMILISHAEKAPKEVREFFLTAAKMLGSSAS